MPNDNIEHDITEYNPRMEKGQEVMSKIETKITTNINLIGKELGIRQGIEEREEIRKRARIKMDLHRMWMDEIRKNFDLAKKKPPDPMRPINQILTH